MVEGRCGLWTLSVDFVHHLTSTETIRLIRNGEMVGKELRKRGKREIIYLSLHYNHQNDSCIKMDRDESHFNVSLSVSHNL